MSQESTAYPVAIGRFSFSTGILVTLFLGLASAYAEDNSFLSSMGIEVKLYRLPISDAPKAGKEEALWLLKIAGEGNGAAQNNLALRYATGEDVPKKPELALKWFHSAAEQHVGAAEFNLSIMYGGTMGLPKDDPLVTVWMRKAAQDGFPEAETLLGFLYLEGSPDLPKDEAVGFGWIRKAADQGFAAAQYAVGMAYAYGKNGLSPDKNEEFQLGIKGSTARRCHGGNGAGFDVR